MKSFDCFDTLIARRHITPESIFEEVGRRIGDPTFVQKRIEAKKASKEKTYLDIYRFLKFDPQVELDVEMEHCYPIVRNMQQVSDGDLIISDMYLPSEFIEKMLRKCGLDKDVKIYSTKDGKHKGWIWNTLPEKPKSHLGDNIYSDVEVPRTFGIKTSLSTLDKRTLIESYILTYDKQMAYFCRFLRLQSPYGENSFEDNIWIDQANLNIPWLIYGALKLPNRDGIYFNFRDCVYLKPIWEKLTGRQSNEFHSSRIFFQEHPEQMKEYLKTTGISKDSIIVDIFGRGKRPFAFFQENIPNYYYLSGDVLKHERIHSFLEKHHGYYMEKFNRMNIGSAIAFINDRIIRKENEYEPKIFDTQNQINKIALANMDNFRFIKNDSLFLKIFEYAKNSFTDKNVLLE